MGFGNIYHCPHFRISLIDGMMSGRDLLVLHKVSDAPSCMERWSTLPDSCSVAVRLPCFAHHLHSAERAPGMFLSVAPPNLATWHPRYSFTAQSEGFISHQLLRFIYFQFSKVSLMSELFLMELLLKKKISKKKIIISEVSLIQIRNNWGFRLRHTINEGQEKKHVGSLLITF